MKKSLPGSIYKPANCNRLYINFKGRRIATGLVADRQGYAIANRMLEKIFINYHNLQDIQTTVTYREAWSEYKETLVHKAMRTIESYESSFKTIIKNIDDYITLTNVEAYILNYLRTTKHSKVTININLTQFQIFLNYCTERKWLEKTKFKSKYSFKLERHNALSYTRNECYSILKYFLLHNKEMAYFIWLQLETGARVVDLLTLEWKQIDFLNERITWLNKITKLEEARPASKKAIKILLRLKKMNKAKVFSWSYSSQSKLTKRLSKAMISLGIERGKRSLQEFRVTFRMRMAQRGMPENLIEYLLRHSSSKLMDNYYTDYVQLDKTIRAYLNPVQSNTPQKFW